MRTSVIFTAPSVVAAEAGDAVSRQFKNRLRYRAFVLALSPDSIHRLRYPNDVLACGKGLFVSKSVGENLEANDVGGESKRRVRLGLLYDSQSREMYWRKKRLLWCGCVVAKRCAAIA